MALLSPGGGENLADRLDRVVLARVVGVPPVFNTFDRCRESCFVIIRSIDYSDVGEGKTADSAAAASQVYPCLDGVSR